MQCLLLGAVMDTGDHRMRMRFVFFQDYHVNYVGSYAGSSCAGFEMEVSAETTIKELKEQIRRHSPEWGRFDSEVGVDGDKLFYAGAVLLDSWKVEQCELDADYFDTNPVWFVHGQYLARHERMRTHFVKRMQRYALAATPAPSVAAFVAYCATLQPPGFGALTSAEYSEFVQCDPPVAIVSATRHCPSGHTLQDSVRCTGGACGGCGGPVLDGERVVDCRECKWHLCKRCQPEGAVAHVALCACLTDTDMSDGVRRAIMALHHDAQDREVNLRRSDVNARSHILDGETENLHYVRSLLRKAAYTRDEDYDTTPKQILDRGGQPTADFSAMPVKMLQALFARVNNAELQCFYGGTSFDPLREHASLCGIKLTHKEQETTENIRRRLAEVDRQWVRELKLHCLDTPIGNFNRGDDVNDLIYQQFGCMSRADAQLHFEVITTNGHKGYEPGPVFRQSSPGRGTPRIRFRKKLRGLVPNRLMRTLVYSGRASFCGLQTVELEGAGGKKALAKAREQSIAQLQQRWRPLEKDGFRLVSLLMACPNDASFMGIDINNAFADAMRKEQFYCKPWLGDLDEVSAFCRALGLNVSTRRRCEDYAASIKKYAQGRARVLRDLQEPTVEKPQLFHWKPMNGEVSSECREVLNKQYASMKAMALLEECRMRKLTAVDPDSKAAALRSRLQASDEAFEQHFPTERLEEISVKRLRTLAPLLGVTQGDQTADRLRDNFAALAQTRAELRRRRRY